MGAGGSEDIRESSTLFHMEVEKSVFPLCESVSPDIWHLESAGSLHYSEPKCGHSCPSVFVTTASAGTALSAAAYQWRTVLAASF